MKKLSAHDEREVKDYVKHNPDSLNIDKKKSVAKKMKLSKRNGRYAGDNIDAKGKVISKFYD